MDRKTAFDRTFKVLHRHSTELIAIDALAIALNALYTLLSRYKLLPSAYLASPRHYSSEKLRYELRMKPFFSVSLPDSIAFELFEQEAGLLGNDDEMVLERAVLAVAEAKKGLEQCLREGPFMDNKNTQTTTEKEHNKEKLAAPSSLAEDWTTDFRNSLRACIATSIAIGTFKRVFTANKSSFLTKAGSKNTHPGTASRRLNLSVEIPEIGSKGRWHNWWAVPKISEILPVRTGAQAVKNRSTEN